MMQRMQILVLGACGMLGRDVVDILEERGEYNFTALCHIDCDITSRVDVLEAVEKSQPDVIINCVAYTDVDGCESDPSRALEVNAIGPTNLVQVLRGTRIKLINISTDYVFDGTSVVPYVEDDATRPLNVYGMSKRDGEITTLMYEHGYVVRTAWLYGRHGRNFPKTILGLAAILNHLNVVNDQYGQPTWTRDLAILLLALAKCVHNGDPHLPPGVYHATASGVTTWYDLAREVFQLAGFDPERVRAVSSSEFPRPANRPTNSVLSSVRVSQTGLVPVGDWRLRLRAAFEAGVFHE
jgi:dTDP-4-dehydrorhamnose reductase